MTTINSSQSDVPLLGQTLNNYFGIADDSSATTTIASGLLKSNQTKKQSVATYGGASSSAGSAALQKALKEIGKEKNGAVTYSDVQKYQEDLELDFSLTLRVDVAQKGVDPEQPFSLKLDPNGKVSVECDDEASKSIIEQHLKDNESVAQKFAYIQALSNLERARQVNGGIDSQYSTESASVEYMSTFLESFFNSSLDTNFNIATTTVEFKGAKQDTSFYTGLDISV